MTLTAKVEQSDVSRMVTAKGVVSAVDTADLNFQAGDSISEVDVKVGDKVKSGQKLGQLSGGGLRRALAQAQQALAQQRAALNLLLDDYTVPGDYRIWQRAKDLVDQDLKNVKLKYWADQYATHRQAGSLRFDRQTLGPAKAQWDSDLRSGACRPNGQPVQPTLPTETAATYCGTDLAALRSAQQTLYNDQTTRGGDFRGAKVDRGGLLSTYQSDREAAVTAFANYNIAKYNRPNQIAAQQALVASALVDVGTALGNLENAYVYAPMDGTITAINGTLGEYNQGGNNLTPSTPLAPGGTAKIPTTGDLAGLDQKSLTGGQGPNLGLQNVLPGGNTFIQMADLSDFSVVAAFNQTDGAQINPGSAAKVAFDTFPGKTTDGTVTAVSPIATTAADGVPMYYATVLLNKDQIPPALKSGLTGNVSVVTSTIQNKALVVPTSAVARDDGQSYVQVPGPGGKPQKKMFTAGTVGDDNTQVVNGLKSGDTVFVPDSGPLPAPADTKAPAEPTSRTLVIDHPHKPPVTPAAPAPQASGPAPAPAAAADTYPGDPGELPDPGTTANKASGAVNGNATPGGVNPFAAPAPRPAPAN